MCLRGRFWPTPRPLRKSHGLVALPFYQLSYRGVGLPQSVGWLWDTGVLVGTEENLNGTFSSLTVITLLSSRGKKSPIPAVARTGRVAPDTGVGAGRAAPDRHWGGRGT